VSTAVAEVVDDDLWSAIGDPTRRRMLDLLLLDGDGTATTLGQQLPVTRQAVAKHLGVLSEARLVDARRTGRELRYRVTPDPMSDAIDWMTRVGGEWDERLARLPRHVAPQASSRPEL
jgi:DNA-binding transcriptional ArsR family regulator